MLHSKPDVCVCVFHFESLVQVTITSVSEVKEGTHSHAVITLDVARDCNEDSFTVTLVTKDGSATRMYTYAHWANDYVRHRICMCPLHNKCAQSVTW